MKRICVVSDTHFDTSLMRQVLPGIPGIDGFVHLGDCASDAAALREMVSAPVYAVRGNNDFASSLPEEIVLFLGGQKLIALHGHRQHVKGGLLRLLYHAKEQEAAAVLYGHTHLADVSWQEGVLLLNPGSLCRAGSLGKPSYMILELRRGQITPTIVTV